MLRNVTVDFKISKKPYLKILNNGHVSKHIISQGLKVVCTYSWIESI